MAGANEGGTLILHANPTLLFTSDTQNYCGMSALDSCSAAVTSVDWDPGKKIVFYAIAAFPSGRSPRLKVLSFGIDYDPTKFVMAACGTCAGFEIPGVGWPAPGTGTSQSWTTGTQTGLLTEAYWFAGYAYSGQTLDSTSVALIPHPAQHGVFVDDAFPSEVDTIAAYGRLGFGTAGSVLCPDGDIGTAPPPGPPEYDSSNDIRLPEFDLFGYTSEVVEEAKLRATEAIRANYGGAWRVYSWNPQTGTPSILYGTGAAVAPPLEGAEQAVAAAKRVIVDNPQVLRAQLGDLRLTSTRERRGRTTVDFQQTYAGLDVVGGRVSVTVTARGRLCDLGSAFYSNIHVDTQPGISLIQAQTIAQKSLAIFNPATDWIGDEGDLMVLPVPVSETEVTHHLIWRVTVHTENPFGAWSTYVDAHDGAIVKRKNEINALDFVGTTRGLVERPSPCGGQRWEPFPHVEISVAGVGTAVADSLGSWALAYGGTDPHTVTATLSNDYVTLDYSPGPDASFSGTATPGVPLAVDFTNANAQRDELGVFAAVGDIRRFIQMFEPGSVVSGLFDRADLQPFSPSCAIPKG
jgi:hypothetical protein